VVVDVQRGMFEGEGIEPVQNGDLLLERVERLVREARNAGVPVVFVQHDGDSGHPLEVGSQGWEIHPRVAPLDGEPVVRKRTPDAFHETTLREELESRGIARLVLAGIQTENCVDTTCRRAFSLGYDVVLAKDARGTWDTDLLSADRIVAHHNAVLGDWFATALEADEIEFRRATQR
jgi:nicotinamidase-related amidase